MALLVSASHPMFDGIFSSTRLATRQNMKKYGQVDVVSCYKRFFFLSLSRKRCFVDVGGFLVIQFSKLCNCDSYSYQITRFKAHTSIDYKHYTCIPSKSNTIVSISISPILI